MPKRHRHLFPLITSPEALHAAWLRAAKDKRSTYAYLAFKEHAPAYLASIREALLAGAYTPESIRSFHVYEPKKRLIEAPAFCDRIVQHAIHAVIEPIFDAIFHPRTYACRVGKGTHHGTRRVQAELRVLHAQHGEDVYFLKTDFKSYFHNIDRAILWREIRRKIACPRTLHLISLYLPETGKGIGIGSLLSQLFANLYGHIFDRHLTSLGIRRWHRYMDDCVILLAGRDAIHDLSDIQRDLRLFAAETMAMTFSKWSIQSAASGVNYLGYRIWHSHKLIRPDSVRRAKRKLANIRKHGDLPALVKFSGSWTGHAIHADSHHLLKKLVLI